MHGRRHRPSLARPRRGRPEDLDGLPPLCSDASSMTGAVLAVDDLVSSL